jgi:predicted flap endonuclease-1-like 5' DNA nuclease
MDQTTTTRFYRNADGTLTRLEGVNYTPPTREDEGAEEITEAEFEAAIEAHRAQQQQRAREQEAADQAEAKTAYDVLRLLPGITAAVASRLTGYQPPTSLNQAGGS